ncbi:MAG: hypothetical protein ACK5N8_04055 [Alphaproteobacteria bacterium]
MTIYKETQGVSGEVNFNYAKELLNSGNIINIPYAVTKPGVLYQKEKEASLFFPAIYLSSKNINQVDWDELQQKLAGEKIATVERSECFNFIFSAGCKIKHLLPLVQSYLSKQKQLPNMEMLFLPERSKTIIYCRFSDKNNELNSVFCADFIQEIPIYEKMEKK